MVQEVYLKIKEPNIPWGMKNQRRRRGYSAPTMQNFVELEYECWKASQ